MRLRDTSYIQSRGYYVTLTTFTYRHVVNKSTKISPTFFGPMLVHTEKSYESHYYFLHVAEPGAKAANITVVGTDGEPAIVKALLGEKMVHLWCSSI